MELISQQIWIWRLLFLWVVMLNGCYGCWEQERIALLQLKASLNHPNGRSLPSWIQNTKESSDCCQWERVLCTANTGRVIKLELNYTRGWDNSRDWYLNASMFLPFQELKILYLTKNGLGGWYDNQGSPCLTNLEVLDLSYNNLNNGILSSLGGLKSLKSLDLSWNNIGGSVQIKDLDALINLEELVLSGNQVNRFVAPKGIKSLSKLKVLYLNTVNCNNTSILLRSMGAFSFLKTIYLRRYSSLQDKINAHDLHDLNNLEELLLDYSSVDNNFLQGVGFMFSLKVLSLHGCQLNGTLHAKVRIGTLSSLSILLLKGNRFEGRIPIEICHLKNLSMIDLSQNNLFGPIPPCLSNSTFEATDDKFLIPNYSWISQYSPWNLVSKFLNGTILNLMWTYSESNLMWYPVINVEEQVEFTTKSRSDYYKGKILKLLSGIDLSCNQLTGEIPHQIGNLHNIQVLNLSHNSLTGSIPTTFSNLRQIESLDLSYNHLNGTIPSQLIGIPWLAVFSVAHNNLSGMIPEQKGQFGTFEESSYKGNPFLCGPPLHNNCTTSGSPPPTIPNDEVEDGSFVDMNIFSVSFLVAYVTVLLSIATVLYINPYWRQAWFHVIEVGITSCYYFVLDNIPKKLISKNN